MNANIDKLIKETQVLSETAKIKLQCELHKICENAGVH